MNTYQINCNLIKKKTTVRDYLIQLNISTSTIKDLSKEFGLIKINNKNARTNDLVQNGDIIFLNVKNFECNEVIPIEKNVEIVFEDNYFLIAFKPKGTATIPSKNNYLNSLANFIVYHMKNKKKDFIFRAINRLDKDAEGYIVIAKDKLIYSLLKNNIWKFYTAICYGEMLKTEITSSIATIKKDNRNEQKRTINSTGKESLTQIIKSYYIKEKDISFCKIFIHTGRTHQIRPHLSSEGCPIIGDKLYGNIDKDNHLEINELQLYCNEIYVWHPILNKALHFKREIFNPELSLAYLEDY